ncbi:site-specific integrase [Furfurilactobacillus curtus]|uniref:Site-specific integrase n=1 Tax=Furfurilactobacillus curtus TaxID=1746200 RepID=A0ABQ5JQY2_9LACO
MTSPKFHEYYLQWIRLYKAGAVRPVTYDKYKMCYQNLVTLVPDLRLDELTRLSYQQLLNTYAETHERVTTTDFHHHLKASLMDALDDGLIKRDPTRKVVIKGTVQRSHKPKFLNQKEFGRLMDTLFFTGEADNNYLIALIAKTGIRFSEALAVTPKDFDFKRQMLTINKTWNYKSRTGGFAPTKNRSSVRKVSIDWQTLTMFSRLTQDLPSDQPIFASTDKPIFNATVNDFLRRKCMMAGVPAISVHALRHTHASLLLYAGVSLASVSRRLGHANMTTTQKVYLHVIQELENVDNDKIMRYLSSL